MLLVDGEEMIKRPVSKKNFRRKVSEDDEVDNPASKPVINQSNNVGASGSIGQVNAVKSKSHAVQSASSKVALSFNHDEDEEGDVFVVKKSAESKNIAKLFRQSKEKSESQPSASYIKPSVNKKPTNNLTSTHKHNSSISNPTQPIVKPKLSSDIPDAATIHALKKQRELKRQYGSDYVPVDDTVRYQSQESLANKTGETNSRLVREDDNDKSDTEEDYRQLSFSNIKNT